MSRPLLSTHALDTSSGSPAAGLFVELYKKREDTWTLWHSTVTCGDGRVHFPFSQDSMAAGTYKLKFNVEEYYKKTARSTLYPFIEVVFNTAEGAHYHIPLLLSPYGYTTYRDSISADGRRSVRGEVNQRAESSIHRAQAFCTHTLFINIAKQNRAEMWN